MLALVIYNLTIWDRSILIRIRRLCGKRTLDSLMVFASHLGDGYFYPFFFLSTFFWSEEHARSIISLAALGYALELFAYKILKTKTKRARPCDNEMVPNPLIQPSDEFSFPSGHTAAAFVFASLIQDFYPEYTLFAFAYAIIVGFSRIYNGVHYPSDVLAGGTLGIFSVAMARLILY